MNDSDPSIGAYQDAVRACALLAGLLLMHDLPALLRAIERADAIGPLVDPTLWRDKGAAMLQDKELLEAALPLWQYARARKADATAPVASAPNPQPRTPNPEHR